MPRRGSSKPPAEPVVKPYGCDLKNMVGLSQGTLAKLSKNEMVSMDVIVRICRTLDCTVDEILDIVPSPDNGTADDIQS